MWTFFLKNIYRLIYMYVQFGAYPNKNPDLVDLNVVPKKGI